MTMHATAALVSLTLVAATAVDAGAQQRGTRQGGAQRPAAAQQARGPQCDITSTGSKQITDAYEALSKFSEAAETDTSRTRLLATATRLLTSPPDQAGTETARQYVLAQTLAAWSSVPKRPAVGEASAFGFAGGTGPTVDVLAMTDSLLKQVVTAKPGCATQIAGIRRLAVVGSVNNAVALYNEAQTDPERDLATQILDRAVLLTKGDTTLGEVRSATLQSLGTIYQNRAATADDAQKREFATKAVAAYEELSTMQPDNAGYKSSLTQARVLAGDTAAIANQNAEMLRNPASYSVAQLIDAGVGALNAEKPADAVSLVEAAVAKNPYYRDGLYVLAAAHLQAEQHAKAAEVTQRLIALDPSNPDNHQMLVNAYQGMLATLTDNGAKRAYTDSLVRTQARAQQMPVKVSFTDFQVPGGTSAVLNGLVENRGAADASYTLKFEFLDARGSVVATKEEAVAAVPARGSKPFSISVQGANIVGYRYAPVATP